MTQLFYIILIVYYPEVKRGVTNSHNITRKSCSHLPSK